MVALPIFPGGGRLTGSARPRVGRLFRIGSTGLKSNFPMTMFRSRRKGGRNRPRATL
jgi:hypothetical protein